MNASDLLRRVTTEWVEDDESDVVWCGEHDGRWGIRMAQETRDFTTIWFDVGEITIGFEAYLLPPPRKDQAEVLGLCLKRNWRSWPAYIAADVKGELYVRGRIPIDNITATDIEMAVGAVYQLVELTFRPLIRLGY
ncbi:MAG: hypothetical protein HKN91_16670 [Acidimicrobiia bacterium]|nr:hypothetical protein [Acidimicrobiia bacterium]